DDHPLAVRLELGHQSGETAQPAAVFHVEHLPAPSPFPTTARGGKGEGVQSNGRTSRQGARELAARLLQMPMVVSVELLDEDPGSDRRQLIVRARQPRAFFEALGRLVLEEWFDLREVLPLVDSTSAVLGYLLGGGVVPM